MGTKKSRFVVQVIKKQVIFLNEYARAERPIHMFILENIQYIKVTQWKL